MPRGGPASGRRATSWRRVSSIDGVAEKASATPRTRASSGLEPRAAEGPACLPAGRPRAPGSEGRDPRKSGSGAGPLGRPGPPRSGDNSCARARSPYSSGAELPGGGVRTRTAPWLSLPAGASGRPAWPRSRSRCRRRALPQARPSPARSPVQERDAGMREGARSAESDWPTRWRLGSPRPGQGGADDERQVGRRGDGTGRAPPNREGG